MPNPSLMREVEAIIRDIHAPYKQWVIDREYVLLCTHCKTYAPCEAVKRLDQGDTK